MMDMKWTKIKTLFFNNSVQCALRQKIYPMGQLLWRWWADGWLLPISLSSFLFSLSNRLSLWKGSFDLHLDFPVPCTKHHKSVKLPWFRRNNFRKVTRMQRKYIQKLIDICGRANLSRNRLFNHIFIDLEPFENSAAALRGLWQRSHYSWIMRPQCCLKRSPNEQDQFKRHTGVELCVSLTDFGNGPKYSMLVFQMRYK